MTCILALFYIFLYVLVRRSELVKEAYVVLREQAQVLNLIF